MSDKLCIFLLLTGVSLHAASFDCKRAKTPQEKAICSSSRLGAADDRMAAAYFAVLRQVPPSFQDELRASQRVWIRRLSTACPAGKPEQRDFLETCIMMRENARTGTLKQMIYKQNGITFAWHSVFREIPGDPDATEPGEGPGSLEAYWPEALSNSPEWEAWNRAVADRTYTIAGLAPPNTPTPQMKDWEASEGEDASITASLDFVNSQVVASTITGFWDGHGAHPSTHWFHFNWLLQKQRTLRPEDIFRANSNWRDVLYSLTDEYLHKSVDDYDPAEIKGSLHTITDDPENWQIDEKGLSIVFQQYAVSCYACTPRPFTIYWRQLRPLLNPDFIVPDKQ